MAIEEPLVKVTCDDCGRVEFIRPRKVPNEGYAIDNIPIAIRALGWDYGKKQICPECQNKAKESENAPTPGKTRT